MNTLAGCCASAALGHVGEGGCGQAQRAPKQAGQEARNGTVINVWPSRCFSTQKTYQTNHQIHIFFEIPYFEVVRTFLLIEFSSTCAETSRARTGALAWVGVGVGVLGIGAGIKVSGRVGFSRIPLVICKKN